MHIYVVYTFNDWGLDVLKVSFCYK